MLWIAQRRSGEDIIFIYDFIENILFLKIHSNIPLLIHVEWGRKYFIFLKWIAFMKKMNGRNNCYFTNNQIDKLNIYLKPTKW